MSISYQSLSMSEAFNGDNLPFLVRPEIGFLEREMEAVEEATAKMPRNVRGQRQWQSREAASRVRLRPADHTARIFANKNCN